ncbi:hypothetical protein QQF64_029293 [Cirrhinus molitorella]|uniref:Uncharacterized protein n=1 Tax=Cirrhinus molitorella TaxID=172907 RepID=A0ABR3N8Y7_9TELE
MMRRGPATRARRLNSQTCSLMGFNEMSAPRRITNFSVVQENRPRSTEPHLHEQLKNTPSCESSTRSQRQKCDVYQAGFESKLCKEPLD